MNFLQDLTNRWLCVLTEFFSDVCGIHFSIPGPGLYYLLVSTFPAYIVHIGHTSRKDCCECKEAYSI